MEDSNMSIPPTGLKASLIALRNELQDQYSRYQVWGGQTVDGDDFLMFVSTDRKRFAVLGPADNSGDLFKIILSGTISFLHRKNLLRILTKDFFRGNE